MDAVLRVARRRQWRLIRAGRVDVSPYSTWYNRNYTRLDRAIEKRHREEEGGEKDSSRRLYTKIWDTG